MRTLAIKNWNIPQFANESKLINIASPIQGYGKFDIQVVNVAWLNFAKVGMITRFDFTSMTSTIQLRVSFYNMTLDTHISPIIYS